MHSNSTYISNIDVSTGALLSYECDFEINGVLPFVLERYWHSDSAFLGRLGHG